MYLMYKSNITVIPMGDLVSELALFDNTWPRISPRIMSCLINQKKVELFYLNSTLNFGIPIVFVFQLEVYYKADRLLTGLTAQQKGTTARWYSNKTSL